MSEIIQWTLLVLSILVPSVIAGYAVYYAKYAKPFVAVNIHSIVVKPPGPPRKESYLVMINATMYSRQDITVDTKNRILLYLGKKSKEGIPLYSCATSGQNLETYLQPGKETKIITFSFFCDTNPYGQKASFVGYDLAGSRVFRKKIRLPSVEENGIIINMIPC